MKIYVASSWRNPDQETVVQRLREEGHEVYDFKNPTEDDHGFHWSDLDINWERWSPEKLRECLSSPLAEKGYASDFNAMDWADVLVGVMPFGRSASLEMGWGAGNGKKTILLLSDGEPELMIKMLDHICCTLDEVVETLKTI